MDKIKAIAIYLPQFHRVKENDEWWGDGFTEWTTVKNAKSLFDGHDQPKEPLSDNYYDLMNKKTMEWQVDLAKKHAIYGFCFYHYWFKDGKQILEKAAENLLQWKDVDMPFCFSWANESWARSWSNIAGKNSWSDKFEDKTKIEENLTGVLLEQKYGTEKDWENHFEYLLPFFKDKRYVKIDNKPVFIIYKPELIGCLKQMIRCWEQLAKKNGLPGVYIVGRNCSIGQQKILSACLVQELGGTQKIKNGINTISYDDSWKNVLSKRCNLNEKLFLCCAVNYDDTPRRGRNGVIILGGSVDKFKKYYKQLVIKSIKMKNEFVFINAWNEWGEGMYLEPDKKNGYEYLNVIREVMQECNQTDFSDEKDIEIEVLVESDKEIINNKDKQLAKFKGYFNLLHQWMLLKEQSKSLDKLLLNRGYKTIAIYGMGVIGKHLQEELKKSCIKIAYGIDRKSITNIDFKILNINDDLPKVDAVIVTAIFDFETIEEELIHILDCSIISLEELICESF
jgi:hypothetical protein